MQSAWLPAVNKHPAQAMALPHWLLSNLSSDQSSDSTAMVGSCAGEADQGQAGHEAAER